MKKYWSIIIIIILFLSLSIYSHAESHKEAIKALKKLEAKIEMGVNYQKYVEVLGETNAEVKLFLESKSSKKYPDIVTSINKIMDNYKDAAKLWSVIIDHPGRVSFFSPYDKPLPRGGYPYGYEIYSKLFTKYPKAYDKLSNYRNGFGKEITLNDFLSVIWNEAFKETKKLSSYLD
ncbi:MAG: hypothetical protein FJ134_02110 [Deltaproteobacteria bacterium]|nr:hypothetical protein [Deltaproteobacteria bacterium]